ncbi:putative uncharacterized protein DDB_G0274435 [Oppia nitens]|uniref:putative uncharacterized protein DDB_G0274435 n=1 Tax=Oppia nitens TaxID=1686743 RepID=UPI0023DCD7A6|nr:putative uncharacterized protein DDB_G0274435 [Oppia nitens]
MSDNIRVRLEFRGFQDKTLHNSLLSFKKSMTKDVKSLQLLIEKRFQMKKSFALFIDNFVLETTEPIDILRDNDLIVVEPKKDMSMTNIKPKPKIGPKSKVQKLDEKVENVLQDIEVKLKPKIGPKSKVKKLDESEEHVLPDIHVKQKPKIGPKSKVKKLDETEEHVLKDIEIKPKLKPKIGPKSKVKKLDETEEHVLQDIEIKPKLKPKIGPKSKVRRLDETEEHVLPDVKVKRESKESLSTTPRSVSKYSQNFGFSKSKDMSKSEFKQDIDNEDKTQLKEIIKEESPQMDSDLIEVVSNREIPLRKAFKSASSAIKRKPQVISKTPSEMSLDEMKSKRKRHAKESYEAVDIFSPIIILDRIELKNEQKSTQMSAVYDSDDSSDIQEVVIKKVNSIVDKPTVKRNARKSFPKISKTTINGNNDKLNTSESKSSDNNNTNKEETKEVEKETTIDFENSQPLVSIPDVGDIIAFKMVTKTKGDNDMLQSSHFMMASVFNINCETQMIDVILNKNLNRNHSSIDPDDHILTLKLNWTTLLEAKLIQKSSSHIN